MGDRKQEPQGEPDRCPDCGAGPHDTCRTQERVFGCRRCGCKCDTPRRQGEPDRPRELTLSETQAGAERASERVAQWPEWKREIGREPDRPEVPDGYDVHKDDTLWWAREHLPGSPFLSELDAIRACWEHHDRITAKARAEGRAEGREEAEAHAESYRRGRRDTLLEVRGAMIEEAERPRRPGFAVSFVNSEIDKSDADVIVAERRDRSAYAAGKAEGERIGAEKERARVVAWLRNSAERYGAIVWAAQPWEDVSRSEFAGCVLRGRADAIERGDHESEGDLGKG